MPRLEAYREANRARGFALDRAPLMRVALIRTGAREWELLWTHHHLLLDGWSGPRVWADLMAAYDALAAGRTPSLPEPPRFRDYVAWLERQDPGAAERFWRGALAGFDEPTPLPAGRGTPGTAPRVVRRGDLPRPPRGHRPAPRAGARRGVTLTTLFQGAWALLLARYTGRGDVAFGNVVSGRAAPVDGVEEMVGMLINTLPVRVRVPDSASAREWLRGIQTAQTEARQFEHTPLVEVRRWAGLDRRELFETLFVYENFPRRQAGDGDDAAGPRRAGAERRAAARADQLSRSTVAVLPDDELALRFTYDADRLDERRRSARWPRTSAARRGAGRAPGAPAGALDTLDAAESRPPAGGGARGRARGPGRRSGSTSASPRAAGRPRGAAGAHGRRARRGRTRSWTPARARSPGGWRASASAAARAWPSRWSAARGRWRRSSPCCAPAAHTSRSTPTTPPSASPTSWRTPPRRCSSPRRRRGPPAGARRRVLLLDGERGAPEAEPDATGTVDDVAYVIYTSGSTGQPQGRGGHARQRPAVDGRHRAVVPLRRGRRVDALPLRRLRLLRLGDLGRAAVRRPPGDGAVLGDARAGGVPRAARARAGDGAQPDALRLPPAHRGRPRRWRCAGALALRWVVFGGEALELEALRPWIARHGDQAPRLANMYGITETTVHVTWRRIAARRRGARRIERDRRAASGPAALPAGRADAPVPLGVAGRDPRRRGRGGARLPRPALR
jgi:non-ribosomal peptide synthetase component F